MTETSELEKRISKIKRDLGKISEERWRAALSRNHTEHFDTRLKASEKMLENCDSLAQYVAIFSTPLARQIAQKETQARKAFEEVRRTRDPKLLHQWIKEELIPSTRFAERLGHVAASASKTSGTATAFHRWTPE